MKIRQGFVSNSSTTSFTCELCGAQESGWDSGRIEDFGFWSCENEHVICFDCVPESDMEDYLDEDEGYWMVGSGACPICRFEVASNGDMACYLLKVKKINPRRKKLYDREYVAYAVRVKDIDVIKFLAELKGRFNGDYIAFKRSMR